MVEITKRKIEELVLKAQIKFDSAEVEKIVCTQEDASLKSPGVPAHYYRFLYTFTKEYKPALCVELGTHTGISALCMAEGNPQGQIVTLDVNSYLRNECKRPNIEYWLQDSLLPLKRPLSNVDMLFVDTVHNGTRPRNEYYYWLQYMNPEGVIFFDDIYLFDEMKKFWQEFSPMEGEKFDLPIHGAAGFGVVILNKEKVCK